MDLISFIAFCPTSSLADKTQRRAIFSFAHKDLHFLLICSLDTVLSLLLVVDILYDHWNDHWYGTLQCSQSSKMLSIMVKLLLHPLHKQIPSLTAPTMLCTETEFRQAGSGNNAICEAMLINNSL